MVTTEFKLKAYNPKEVANGSKIVFQVADKGKDKKYRYCTIMCNNNDLLQGLADKEDIKLKEIKGFTLSEYNDKTQITLFCEVERLGNPDTMEYDETVAVEISDADLPF